MPLTPKQKQVIDFIREFTHRHGYAPSNQEIANHFSFKSRGTVSAYVRRLKEQGHLTTQARQRSVAITQTANRLPLLGKVAAGKPIEHVMHGEFTEVPANFLKTGFDHYVLQVRGNSMIDDAILDGDYVVIRRQSTAHNGQTVVASIDGEATLKKFYKKRHAVELRPANTQYDAITIKPPHAFRIEGVLVGVLRSLPSGHL